MGGTNAVRPLLAPVSMQATIKRNLSPWYQSHDLPQLASIALHMKKTRVCYLPSHFLLFVVVVYCCLCLAGCGR